MSAEEAFRLATEALYDELRTARPQTIEGCPCCIGEKDICALTTKSLRNLTPRDLASYASSVFLTVDETGFLYFLPRILEISATDRAWYPSPEIVLERLKRAGWADWRNRRKQVVRDFLGAWVAMWNEDQDAWDVDGLICGIGLSGDDVGPYLEQLIGKPRLLADWWGMNRVYEWTPDRMRLANGFWEECEGARRVAEFLNSDRVRAIVERAYLEP